MQIPIYARSRQKLLFAAAFMTASSAFASGSMSPGLSNGPDAYSVGKSVLFKQVVCSSCPYAGRAKDATDAKSLRDTINSADSKVKLSADDRDAVNTYLNERFRLAMADKK
jgi:hypothetical protein